MPPPPSADDTVAVDGLPANRIRAVDQDESGATLALTDGGLATMRDAASAAGEHRDVIVVTRVVAMHHRRPAFPDLA